MKPVVFVPGLPGSELLDAATGERLFLNLGLLISKTARQKLLPRLEGPDNPTQPDGVVAGLPIADVLDLPLFDAGKQAQSLYDTLRRLGYTGFRPPFGSHFRAVGWDWRLPVDHAVVQGALAGAIDELHASTGDRVVPIVHSTGGLVLRALLEAQPALVDKIDRVLSLGVPWAGTLKAFRFVVGTTGFFPLTKAETQHTIGRSWAAFDLLPPDPAKTPDAPPLVFAGNGDASSPLVDHAWIPAGPDRAPMVARAQRSDQQLGRRSRRLELGGRPLAITTVAGWGVATDTTARLAGGNVQLESTPEGDGTVPFLSASWLRGVQPFFAPLGFYPTHNLPEHHSTLWKTPPVQDLLAELLTGASHRDFAHAAVDSDDAINQRDRVRVRVVALDGMGNPLPGATVRISELTGPADPPIALQGDGRGEVKVARNRMRRVQTGSARLLRFQVTIDWNGGSKGPLTFQFMA
jgi:Lecithin:cholesterol acyltransferase